MSALLAASELWHCLPRLWSEAAPPQAVISCCMQDAAGLLCCGLVLYRSSSLSFEVIERHGDDCQSYHLQFAQYLKIDTPCALISDSIG